MKWVKQWDVPSHSNPKKKYVVSKADDGTFGCDCPVWKFRRQECKHIEQVKHHLAMGNDYGRTLFRQVFTFIPYKTEGTDVKVERKLCFETAIEQVIVYFPLIHFTDVPYIQADGSSAYDGFTHNRQIYENILKEGVPLTEIKKYFRLK